MNTIYITPENPDAPNFNPGQPTALAPDLISGVSPATPAAPTEPPLLILDAFCPATRRQMELTVNALSRSVRKAIRQAELMARDDSATPEAQAAAWQRVTDRSHTLQEFVRSLVIPRPAPVPAPAPAPIPQPQPIPAAAPVEAEEEEDDNFDDEAFDEVDELGHDPNATPNATPDDDLQALQWTLSELKRVESLPEHTHPQRCRKAREIEAVMARIEKRNPKIAAQIRAGAAAVA